MQYTRVRVLEPIRGLGCERQPIDIEPGTYDLVDIDSTAQYGTAIFIDYHDETVSIGDPVDAVEIIDGTA